MGCVRGEVNSAWPIVLAWIISMQWNIELINKDKDNHRSTPRLWFEIPRFLLHGPTSHRESTTFLMARNP